MQRTSPWMLALLAVTGLWLSACSPSSTPAGSKTAPSTVERVPGTNVNRVRLTPSAAQRLGIQTAAVRMAQVARRGTAAGGEGAQHLAIPYSAVIYDPQGDTWTYTNLEPLVFTRQRIHVDYIEGELAVLSEGPPVGAAVVIVGAAELFGIDFGLGK